MPIYEYVCEKCGNNVEVIQKISDEPLKRCAKCRGKLKKSVSRTSFQLKGSGWYVTDYSSKDTAKDKGDATGSDKVEKAPEKKPEKVASKPAASDGD